MRPLGEPPAEAIEAFQIPMRGYETDYIRCQRQPVIVPNPHEGL